MAAEHERSVDGAVVVQEELWYGISAAFVGVCLQRASGPGGARQGAWWARRTAPCPAPPRLAIGIFRMVRVTFTFLTTASSRSLQL